MANYNSIMDALYAKIDDYIERGILDKSAKSSTIQECLNKIVRLSLDDMSNPEAGGALIEKMNNSDMVISDQLALVLEAYANSIGSNKYEDSDVRFIGMNGDVIYGYSKDEFLALTQMPPNPKVEGFTSQGWNYNFEDAQEYVSKYGKLNVGQMYIPSDGKTHMIMELKERLTIPLTIQQTVSEGVTINWGDGSEEETIEGTGAVTTSHTYASEGEYEITFEVAEGCTLDFGDGTNNVFGESATRLYISSLKKVFIGKNVTSIGVQAFSNCYALTSLTIPDGVTSIGVQAFSNCYVLTSLTIPDSVTSIENYAFSSCYALISLIIPDGVTSIEQWTFSSCYALISLIIPDGVTSIGANAFANCYKFNTLTVLAETPPTLSLNTFHYIPTDCTFYVPYGTGDTYKAASEWYTWASQIQELPNPEG